MGKSTLIYKKVYLTVSKIPYGKVATYGQIAELIYEYGRARQVGWALRRLKLPSIIPWHQVINFKCEITMRSLGILNWIKIKKAKLQSTRT